MFQFDRTNSISLNTIEFFISIKITPFDNKGVILSFFHNFFLFILTNMIYIYTYLMNYIDCNDYIVPSF